MKFHLIGIGGAGMSVVAQLLAATGNEITGSDQSTSEYTAKLAESGISVSIGHSAAHVPADAVVIYSSAIKPNNPEYEIALQRGQKMLHRSQALALAGQQQNFVAVAGAHGKTSTSAMLAVALDHLGLDPSRAIGGALQGGISGGYLGKGNVIVAEADESDGSFLNYRPRIALVTNIEPDHLDHYHSPEKFAAAFLDFAHCIVPGGLLICCADNAGSHQLAKAAAAAGIRVHTYGEGEKPEFSLAHAQLKLRSADPQSDAAESRAINCATAVLTSAERPQDFTEVTLSLQVPGRHMLLNSLGALLAGIELGVAAPEMAQALAHFQGTARRFERRGQVRGITVIDDYAHHPTEVSATLVAARQMCRGKLHVLFQPHLYSRTTNFKHEFAASLALADHVVITAAYAARETPADGDDGDAISALLPGAKFIANMKEAAVAITAGAQAGDFIFTMGAGDVTKLGEIILRELRKGEK